MRSSFPTPFVFLSIISLATSLHGQDVVKRSTKPPIADARSRKALETWEKQRLSLAGLGFKAARVTVVCSMGGPMGMTLRCTWSRGKPLQVRSDSAMFRVVNRNGVFSDEAERLLGTTAWQRQFAGCTLAATERKDGSVEVRVKGDRIHHVDRLLFDPKGHLVRVVQDRGTMTTRYTYKKVGDRIAPATAKNRKVAGGQEVSGYEETYEYGKHGDKIFLKRVVKIERFQQPFPGKQRVTWEIRKIEPVEKEAPGKK